MSSTDVAIRILRPYIIQILYKYGVAGEFLFVLNGVCIEFEKELTTPLKAAITSLNGTNSLIVRSIKAMQAVQAVQTVQSVQSIPPMQSVQSAQSMQSLYPHMYPEYSQFSFPYGKPGFNPMTPLNTSMNASMNASMNTSMNASMNASMNTSMNILRPASDFPAPAQPPHKEASATNDHPWEYYGNENALQRLLREAKANGQVDEIASQPVPSNADLGLDDTPRELASRNNSNLRFGSYENMYSRNGSMIFPTSSRPGSMVFNPLGSNVSLDFRETSNPMMEELMNRLHEGELDDIDKGAPAL